MKNIITIMVVGFILMTSTASADSGAFTFKTVGITWTAPSGASNVIAGIETRSGKSIEHHMGVALSHMLDVLKQKYAGPTQQFEALEQTDKEIAVSNLIKYKALTVEDQEAVNEILNP